MTLAQNNRTAANPAAVSTILATAGLSVPAGSIEIRQREDRFAAFLPDNLVAWFAISAAGEARLDREARVLELLAKHCSFAAPRVLEHHAGWQLRRLVPGKVDPWAAYQRVISDDGYASELGATIGTLLAEQHLRIPAALIEWLPPRSSWPAAAPSIAVNLPQVIDDVALCDAALATMASYEKTLEGTTARVLTHGDLGLHNLALAPDGSIAGIFDYDDAACSNRHDDFEFLLFDTTSDAMLVAAVTAYEAGGGASIDLPTVALFNAANAIGFLADRVGISPLDRPAGRTLGEDLAWTRQALARLQV